MGEGGGGGEGSGSGAHGLNQLQKNGLKKSLQYSHKYFSMAIEPAFAIAGKVKALAENSVVRHFSSRQSPQFFIKLSRIFIIIRTMFWNAQHII